MDKKTLIIAAVLVVALVGWWPLMHRLGWVSRPGQPPAETFEQGQQLPSASDRSEPNGASEEEPAPVPELVRPAAPARDQALPSGSGTQRQSAGRRLELVRADESRWQLDTGQGGIVSVSLLDYLAAERDQIVQLETSTLPLASVAGNVGFTDPAEVVQESDQRVVLRRRRPDGLVLVESWELPPDQPYQVNYQLSWENSSSAPIAVSDLWISCGEMLERESAGGGFGAGAVGGLAADLAFTDEKRPETLAMKKLVKLEQRQDEPFRSRPLNWVALHTKYFVFYTERAGEPFLGVDLDVVESTADELPALAARAAMGDLLLQPGEQAQHSLRCYAGPKTLQLLRQLDTGADSILSLDLFLLWRPAWMGYISRGILRALLELRDLFNHPWGYGFAIVVVTAVIKMLFWPLTHSSTVSMRRMQKLQPLMQELREKYGDEPQKLNRKMMELYREHKVNPVGGCLPIFFQIPVFFALFNTLRGAIELRQAPFLWVTDLSEPDTVMEIAGLPIRPFALLMAVSMVLQQYTMPSAGDPSQRRMMMFMSVFFIFILYGMPAGLTLYWTVNQLLTMAQYALTRRLERNRSEATSS